ncbi:MAG: hypothetical protein LBR90_03345, partial [Elusimicrobiota bacterium]|nr:hypothetical protein [Elusimicrobiota bacterium]
MNNKILLFAFLLLPAGLNAQDCFQTLQQRYRYEAALSPAEENKQITDCLKQQLLNPGQNDLEAAIAALRKSDNIANARAELMRIFTSSADAQIVFAAACALTYGAADLGAYEARLLNIASSPAAQDYKQTLAIIILAAAEAVDSSYEPFLTPALNAQDPVLKAYARGALTLISPQVKGEYLADIVFLYSFDKAFALRAFAASGLKQKALRARLKETLGKGGAQAAAAAQWIGDLNDKNLLSLLLETDFDPGDAAALSAAANALAENYPLMLPEIKKTLKRGPPAASAAVMALAFKGGAADDAVRELLAGGANEQANGLRVISARAGILLSNAAFYPNPQLEIFRIKKFIPAVAGLGLEGQSPQTKIFAQTANREL